MGIKHEVRKFFWKFGYDIAKFTPRFHPIARRKQILKHYAIDTVLDIGANSGQYARQLREDFGYTQKILSFEPLSSAFEVLKEKSAGDSKWEVFNVALGEKEGLCEINIAANSYSSSLLDMLPSHLKSAPESRYIGKESIKIRTLDSFFSDLCEASSNIYMKIDTQGFESRVIKGAAQSLSHIDTVQMEMSLVPMYDGELLFNDMCKLMSEKGYSLIAIEPGFADQESGQLLQVDGIFHRL
jgi:FkbM family methyltransferase